MLKLNLMFLLLLANPASAKPVQVTYCDFRCGMIYQGQGITKFRTVSMTAVAAGIDEWTRARVFNALSATCEANAQYSFDWYNPYYSSEVYGLLIKPNTLTISGNPRQVDLDGIQISGGIFGTYPGSGMSRYSCRDDSNVIRFKFEAATKEGCKPITIDSLQLGSPGETIFDVKG